MISLKVRILVVLLLFCIGKELTAKDVKPTLLVYGDGIEAFAAALQAARSNVPTIWVFNSSGYLENLTKERLTITSNAKLLGGVWKDILIETGQLKSNKDSVIAAYQKGINPQLLRNAFERLLAKQPNLTVLSDVKIIAVSKGKKELTVVLSNKRKYAVRAMVDATADAETRKLIEPENALVAKPSRILPLGEIDAKLRRTLVAIGEYDNVVYGYTWADLFSRSTSTVFFTANLVQVALDANSIPLRANVGQAVGAAAAYCSFFKTDAEKVDMRKLQTELLAFDMRFLPFSDIQSSDVHFMALQKLFLVSLLPLQTSEGKLLFLPNEPVKTEGVKTVFNSLYSRSQIWFTDNSTEGFFKLKELLTLIKYVSFRGDEVDREVEKEWSRKLKFEGAYDPAHVVTRYEFCVLLDRYANPYAKAVNTAGEILR